MAAASLGLDYLFLVLYPLAISQACLHLATTRQKTATGLALARLQLLAGPLDAIENAALLMELLYQEHMELYASIAWWCAVPKLGIVAMGLFYIMIGFSKHQCTVPQQSELHYE